MLTVTLVIQRRVTQAIRRTLKIPFSPLNQILFNFNFLCTQAPLNFPEIILESKEGKPSCLSYRIEKLPKGESVGLAFQSWMGDGFPIHRGDIFHAINRLRKLKMNKRALEVMEWVIREKPYRPKELDYSYLLEFTTKFHGILQGEKLFSCVPPEFQNDLLYNNLVIACLDKGSIRLSLAYMKKMRDLGHPISHLIFNRLIILHSSPSRKKIIPKILTQMKADKVTPHVSTYNILMKMEANEHNIEGLMKVYGDMKCAKVEPNEVSYCIIATAHAVARLYTVAEAYVEAVEKSVTGDNWSTLDVLIILYGYLGKGKELERTLGIVQELPHEMEMIECKPNAITFRHLALGCLKANLVEEALRTLELGMDLTASKRVRHSTPWLETTLSIVEMFAEKGDLVNVEKLFEELTKARYTKYTFVYNTLLKAYVKAKKYDPNFLRRMILGGARPDAETYSLMKLAEQFQS
ncbi:pentatricopeptide repeat-containing protein [Quercus suber]|uniref:Pentatricopeptide repeat-containing protein n=1 Tax=Quercus suber TaxID=58331 RepID=A0AAW0LYM9_QUESU